MGKMATAWGLLLVQGPTFPSIMDHDAPGLFCHPSHFELELLFRLHSFIHSLLRPTHIEMPPCLHHSTSTALVYFHFRSQQSFFYLLREQLFCQIINKRRFRGFLHLAVGTFGPGRLPSPSGLGWETEFRGWCTATSVCWPLSGNQLKVGSCFSCLSFSLWFFMAVPCRHNQRDADSFLNTAFQCEQCVARLTFRVFGLFFPNWLNLKGTIQVTKF